MPSAENTPGRTKARLRPALRRRGPTRQEAETEDIVHALRSYGVLTRPRLLDVCGAAHWSDAGAERAIAHAVSSGRIRQLGDDLYEIAEPPTR